jgi:threonine dehydratase
MPIPRLDIEAASARIRRHLGPTPLVRSRRLSLQLGANIFLKLETLQPTHSFKVRGAFSALTRLDAERASRGVVTASGGNHGLAVAYAASQLGIPATVYLPESATEAKLSAIRRLQPEVVIHGAAWDDANALATRVAAESGRSYVHPFDDPAVMAGQATLVAEILADLPAPPDLIVVSVGGGGLITGILSAVSHLCPATRVYGVETIGADSMTQSVAAGRIVELPAITSIAETLGARRTGKFQLETVASLAAGMVTVTDAQAVRALLDLLEGDKLLAEPAMSCSVAALTEGAIPVRKGQTIVVIACGANVGLDKVVEWKRTLGAGGRSKL